MESYHKQKRLLENKFGKLINSKPFNDNSGIVDNSQHTNMLSNYKILQMRGD